MTRLALRLLSALLTLFVLATELCPAPARAAEPVAAPVSPQLASDPRFGAVQAWESPDEARRIGVRWQRVYFWWNDIQPRFPTDWDLRVYAARDQQLELDRAAGIETVGLIGNPPAWATRNLSVPRGLELPTDDPRNVWARFVERLVTEYAGKVDTWIIWNEPDIDPGRPFSTWAGTEEEYYALLKHAALATRKASPRAKVLFGGTTYWADARAGRKLFFERVLEVARRDPTAASNGFYFDAVPIHIYSTANQMWEIPMRYREAMQRVGVSKPIWITESNAIPYNDPVAPLPGGGYRVTMDEQANFVIQGFVLAFAVGVERVAVYKMKDGKIDNGEAFGMVRNNGTYRPALAAYQVASQYLNGLDRLNLISTDNVDVFWQQQGKKRTTIFWNTSGIPRLLRWRSVGTRAQLVNRRGEIRQLDPPLIAGDNFFQFQAPPATVPSPDGPGLWMVGGEPFILVEDGVGDGVDLSPSQRFYPITGQFVSGAMLEYFKSHGQLDVFGYPRTGELTESGKTVQYFQRARLEWDPTRPEDGARVGNLNQEAVGGRSFPGPGPELMERVRAAMPGTVADVPASGTPTATAIPAATATSMPAPAAGPGATPQPTPAPPPDVVEVAPNLIYFPATGHSLQGEFLAFFRSRGGLENFGYPISEEIDLGNGFWIQHFRKLRLEWRENADPKVSLALVGDEMLRARGLLKD